MKKIAVLFLISFFNLSAASANVADQFFCKSQNSAALGDFRVTITGLPGSGELLPELTNVNAVIDVKMSLNGDKIKTFMANYRVRKDGVLSFQLGSKQALFGMFLLTQEPNVASSFAFNPFDKSTVIQYLCSKTE